MPLLIFLATPLLSRPYDFAQILALIMILQFYPWARAYTTAGDLGNAPVSMSSLFLQRGAGGIKV